MYVPRRRGRDGLDRNPKDGQTDRIYLRAKKKSFWARKDPSHLIMGTAQSAR